jgi:hypothetical protein
MVTGRRAPSRLTVMRVGTGAVLGHRVEQAHPLDDVECGSEQIDGVPARLPHAGSPLDDCDPEAVAV